METAIEVRAPRGARLSCRGWQQEAALRMLMNNLDPEVAECPQDLIVYGGAGKAARNWQAYHAIVATLRRLANDETLLVQSGKPVGVFRTHEGAPRVLIANSNLVPEWGTWQEFRRLDALGLTMYGQMTAGSWIYIGTQGILQGTYQTFASCAAKHFGGSLAGRLVLTAGLGGMGGAQPLAITMNGGVALCVEVDGERIRRRLETAYLDTATDSLDEALRMGREAARREEALSIGLQANAADVYPELMRRGVVPDVVTDQTSAHDTVNGYVPNGMGYQEALELRAADAAEYERRAIAAIVTHVEAMVALRRRAAAGLRLRHNIRGGSRRRRLPRPSFPGLCPLHSPRVCPGSGPFPAGGALRRPRRHRAHGPGDSGGIRRERDGGSLDAHGAAACSSPRFAGAHLLARVRRAGARRPAVQPSRGQRRSARPHRDRTRPSGCRLGRVSVS